ncbi:MULTISPECIES: hypothetical protein [Streptomyces]|uniref:hypothetical protein n=1 Tax=Streptomyces TaxID=1883 RepID=UPI001BEE4C4D|nr:hypothetical protein [Streptomyces sp. EAS-AB2608]BCM66463.1 hypothetical protein EASAB2608_01797 [Streptomyces sp. EAS-AB2608]
MGDNDTVKAVKVPLLWVGLDDLPLLSSNQVLTQVDPDHVFLSFGTATPPVLMGNEEQVRDQAKRINYVPVKGIARLAISRRHLGELIEVLQRTAETFDAQGGE